MKKIFLLLAICFVFLASNVTAAVVSQKIDYEEGGQKLQGVLYWDNTVDAARPGVIVFHEWKGLGDYAKKRAMMLAKQGYAVFAADMYGKGVFAETHEKAGELSGVFFKDRAKMRSRAKAALDAFVKTGKVDEFNLAAIGYCFGGTTVLEMARAGFPLKGVASFHGILATPSPAAAGQVQTKVLVLNGAEDKMNSSQDIQTFEDEMRNAGADWQFVNFGGAKHSFTVWDANMPDKGVMYNESADKRSWAMLGGFLKTIMVVPTKGPAAPRFEAEPPIVMDPKDAIPGSKEKK